MASRGVSVLKFVGTVSLGLLTGFSYTLTTVTLPTLLALPSAASAAKAFSTLTTQASTNLRALTALSSSAFLLAFVLSPRPHRHPYLLYTSLLVAASSFADKLAPYLGSNSTSEAAARARQQQHLQQQARRKAAAAAAAARTSRMMEASYEVLGDAQSEGTGSASGADDFVDDEVLNGEEVRVEVESYARTTLIQTAVASVGFLMAVVGIWGDGSSRYGADTIVFV